MPYYSKEQITKARELDLLTYLQRYEPNELIKVGNGVYSTKTHDSLKISNGKWCWWSRGIGGSTALDYLISVEGYTLPSAVERLLREEPSNVPRAKPPPRKTEHQDLKLPEKNQDAKRVFAYLRSRGIDAEIIRSCIRSGQLYEDAKYHNCVFVGFLDGKPRYASLRGTLSGSTFVGEVTGSDKRYAFCMPVKASSRDTLCVFESAIDALSYLTILKQNGKDWRSANCLSLAGIYFQRAVDTPRLPLALESYLQRNPVIKRVVLCLDNDQPGREASRAIERCLDGYEVIQHPPPKGKDYNDYLQIQSGIRRRAKTRGGEER